MESIESYNRDAKTTHEYQAIKLHEKHLNCQKRGALPAYLDALLGNITPFAFECILKQSERVAMYKSAPAGVVGKFLVSSFGNVALAHAPDFDGDGYLLPHADDCDLPWQCGDPRTVTLDNCSCQFQQHWGLPCTHQLHLCLVTGTALSRDTIHAHWQQETIATQQRAYRAFISIPRPNTSASVARAPKSRTAAEFFADSMAVLRPLAEVVTDEKKFGVLQMHALDLFNHFANGAPLKVSDANNDPVIATQRKQLMLVLASSWRVVSLPDRTSVDYGQFILGLQHQHARGRDYLNKRIITRYSDSKWLLATIKQQVLDNSNTRAIQYKGKDYMPNFVVHFDVDADEVLAQVILVPEAYYDARKTSSTNTWCFVEEYLSTECFPEQVQPHTARKRGRPEAKRKMPVHGPTSKAHGKAKGKATHS